jgi:hypothetical protein
MQGESIIEGHIKHRRYGGHWAKECQLWLGLLFDRRLFRKLLTCGYPCGFAGGPMIYLNKLAVGIRTIARDFTPQQCSCGETWIAAEDNGDRGWLCCPACRKLPADQIPF